MWEFKFWIDFFELFIILILFSFLYWLVFKCCMFLGWCMFDCSLVVFLEVVVFIVFYEVFVVLFGGFRVVVFFLVLLL